MDENLEFFKSIPMAEKRDLEDFELLEQLAKDDVSFLSSLSTVDKLLEDHHNFASDIHQNELTHKGSITTEKEKNGDYFSINNSKKDARIKALDEDEEMNFKDSFAFSDRQDGDSWSGEVSQEEEGAGDDYDVQGGDNDDDDYDVQGGDNDDDDYDVDSNENNGGSIKYDNGDNNANQSSKEDISRFKNQKILIQLAQRLFPGMKESSNAKPKETSNAKETEVRKLNQNVASCFELAKNAPIGAGVTSQRLQDKLAELEIEINRFKKENEMISQQKKEENNYVKLLKKELAEFEMTKKVAKEEFERYKHSEIQKLKRDRKIFENYKTAQESNFTREGRKEIESLKFQMEKVKNELKEKERKYQMGLDRWKERVVGLEEENGRLKDESVLRENDRCNLVRQLDTLSLVDRSKSVLSQAKKHEDVMEGRSLMQNIETNEVHDRIKNGGGIKDDEITNGDAKANDGNMENVESLNKFSIDNSDFGRKYLVSQIGESSNEILDRTLLQDGSTCSRYSNGTTKTTFPDSRTTTTYFNGDTKDSFPDGRTIYSYSNSKTRHHTFPDGTEIYYFQSGQTEKHYPVGTREVTFPDGNIKYIDPFHGTEETIFTDGSLLKVHSNGDTEMEFANGQKEIHNDQFKRREYPDGTCKTVFHDGSQQTSYSSGRMRIKDAFGNIVFDGVK